MCSSEGELSTHSVEVLVLLEKINAREFVILSQITQTNMIAETNEIKDPTDEITFQEVKASG